jgi:RNA polymerase sigma-70 factor (ECF subfamily)
MHHTQPSDTILVKRAQEGDNEAFGELYAKHHARVERFIFYKCHDRDLAEDVMAEAFLRAMQCIGSLTMTGEGSFRAWVTTIAKHYLFDYVKSPEIRHTLLTDTDAWANINSMRPHYEREQATLEEQVLSAVERDEWLFHLPALLGRLSDAQLTCIKLRFFEGLSITDTARAMRQSDGAVKALQGRAIATMRRTYERETVQP